MASPSRVIALAAAGLGAVVLANRWAAPAAAVSTTERPKPKPGRFVQLSGTPYERGKAHGEQLKTEIGEVFVKWRAQLTAVFGLRPEAGAAEAQAWTRKFAGQFLGATGYQSAIDKWAPGLLDEVRGMAAGAGLEFAEMLTFQLMDEYWFHGGSVAKAAWEPGSQQPEHCTAFGVPGEKKGSDCPALVAQTMDLESFRDGYQVVFKIVPPTGSREPTALLFSHAGM
eukprot:COSAG05_NODE_4972_length_1307_cov_1.002483_2_plen_225_part_01